MDNERTDDYVELSDELVPEMCIHCAASGYIYKYEGDIYDENYDDEDYDYDLASAEICPYCDGTGYELV